MGSLKCKKAKNAITFFAFFAIPVQAVCFFQARVGGWDFAGISPHQSCAYRGFIQFG